MTDDQSTPNLPQTSAFNPLEPRPTNIRSSLRTLQRAVNEGWQIPEAIIRAAPHICAKILMDNSASPREQLRAAEVLATMMRDTVSAAIALDKMERLDGGEATERLVITPEIRERARQIIAGQLGRAD